MNEKFVVLESSVRADLDAIEGLYTALGEPHLAEEDTEDELIVVAYRLHSLYTAFENIFRNVAVAFENQISDRTSWHRELLQRMKLDLTPIRPAVIDQGAYAKLDELLRFRHFFRTAYGVPLDPSRLQLALGQALALKGQYREQLERFLEFVRTLE